LLKSLLLFLKHVLLHLYKQRVVGRDVVKTGVIDKSSGRHLLKLRFSYADHRDRVL
jgi:hypothetical protein